MNKALTKTEIWQAAARDFVKKTGIEFEEGEKLGQYLFCTEWMVRRKLHGIRFFNKTFHLSYFDNGNIILNRKIDRIDFLRIEAPMTFSDKIKLVKKACNLPWSKIHFAENKKGEIGMQPKSFSYDIVEPNAWGKTVKELERIYSFRLRKGERELDKYFMNGIPEVCKGKYTLGTSIEDWVNPSNFRDWKTDGFYIYQTDDIDKMIIPIFTENKPLYSTPFAFVWHWLNRKEQHWEKGFSYQGSVFKCLGEMKRFEDGYYSDLNQKLEDIRLKRK